MIDDLAPFASRLDGLRADQDPDDLSRALRDASDQDMLYNLYIFSLGGDTERMKALLEIFDKVRSATYSLVDRFSVPMYGTGPSSN